MFQRRFQQGVHRLDAAGGENSLRQTGLSHVALRRGECHRGVTQTRGGKGVSMTGANPNTGWLENCVALDEKGFVKTGPDLLPFDVAASPWPLRRRPLLFETNQPGVFAVGDVRAGSVKRVAAAVGEGSVCLLFGPSFSMPSGPRFSSGLSRQQASAQVGRKWKCRKSLRFEA